MFRYETHCHCSQCSACGHSTSAEIVRAYHDAGYAGLVLTDHFIRGNTAIDRSLPWETKMHLYYDAYLEAKAVGDELDFDVIFGIEEHFGGGHEVLIYNIGLDFLLKNPDMCNISLEELIQRVHAQGGLVYQAHPYRNRSYIDLNRPPRDDVVDGFEVYNASNDSPEENLPAFRLASKKRLLMLSGGDVHAVNASSLSMAGMAFPYRVRNGKEFADAIRKGDGKCIINGQIMEQVTEQALEEIKRRTL